MHGGAGALPDPYLNEALSAEAGVAFPGKPLAELAVSLLPKYSFFELGKTILFVRSCFSKSTAPISPQPPQRPARLGPLLLLIDVA
jgi:hypothetical protein